MDPSEAEDEVAVLKEQRDVAWASAILAAAISVSVFLTVFRDKSRQFDEIRESIRVHRELLEANQSVLESNQQALAEVNEVLARRRGEIP